MERYLIPANGPETEPIKTALVLASKLGQNIRGQVEVVLVTPSKNIFGTTLESVVGQDVIKVLEKGNSITLSGNISMKLESERTLNVYRSYKILIALYPNKRMLDKIDSIKDCAHTIIVPWTMESIEEWAGTWSPKVIGNDIPQKQITIDNPVVEEAMKLLTGAVNLSTGLSHPSDKADAVELFRILFKNREEFDPTSIKAWALQHGWSTSGANQIRDIAEAINNRRPIRGGTHPHWREDIIKVLRESALSNN